MKFLFVLISCIFCFACGSDKLPQDVLPDDQMGKVMWDLLLVDEYLITRPVDSLIDPKKERSQLYSEVFNTHKTNQAQFSKSYKYYVGRPDRLKIIFDTLTARGIKSRDNLYAPMQMNPQ